MELSILKRSWMLGALILVACEEVLDLPVVVSDPKLVVEGYVENDEYPYLILSRSTGFFSRLDSTALAQLGVYGAFITVYDGNQTDTMINVLPGTYPLYVALKMQGVPGRTYELFVRAGSDSVRARCTLGQPVPLDSFWALPHPKTDTLVRLWTRFTEPEPRGNFYRAFTRRNSQPVFQTDFGSVYDDVLVNGKTFNFPINRGENLGIDTTVLDGTYGYFKNGDTAHLIWSHISRPHYDFWRTYESQLYGAGNPFSPPVLVKGNIQGGLGIWGDLSSVEYSIIVKP